MVRLPLSTFGRAAAASGYAVSKVPYHLDFRGLPVRSEVDRLPGCHTSTIGDRGMTPAHQAAAPNDRLPRLSARLLALLPAIGKALASSHYSPTSVPGRPLRPCGACRAPSGLLLWRCDASPPTVPSGRSLPVPACTERPGGASADRLPLFQLPPGRPLCAGASSGPGPQPHRGVPVLRCAAVGQPSPGRWRPMGADWRPTAEGPQALDTIRPALRC